MSKALFARLSCFASPSRDRASYSVERMHRLAGRAGACSHYRARARDDPMVQTLSRNKVDHYADYHLDYFERCLHDVFDFRQRQILDRGIRFLYYSASKKGG